MSPRLKALVYAILGLVCLASAGILYASELYGPWAWGLQLALALCWFLAAILTVLSD